MSAPPVERRLDGDEGRVPPPEWFLRKLIDEAADLLSNRDAPEWQQRADRWREIWIEATR